MRNYLPTQTRLKQGIKGTLGMLLALLSFAVNAQTANFTISDDTLILCNGATASVQFTNTSTSVPGGATYQWNFGNGTPNTNVTSPTQVYTTAGNYNVTLQILVGGNPVSSITKPIVVRTATAAYTISPGIGCEDVQVFQFTNQPIVADSFVWNFGDGNILPNIANPSHTFNYPNPAFTTSLLIYVDGFANACASAYQTVNVTPKPDAIVTVNSTTSCDPFESFNFTNTSVNAVSHLWNFGNGQTSTQAAPSYVFGALGTYNVTYVATSSGGCKDTVLTTININQSTQAQLVANVQSGCSPLTVTFSCPNIPNAQQYVWDLGNGQPPITTTGPQLTHTYFNTTAAPLNYTVSLTAIVGSFSSCNTSVTIPNFITVNPQTPPSFNISGSSLCANLPIQFNNTTAGVGNSYIWEFGANGPISTQANPLFTFTGTGNYLVTLLVTNSYGCKDTLVDNTSINIPNLIPNFTAPTTSGCIVNTNFVNTSVGATSFFWDFGNGQTSTQAAPTSYYNIPGGYDVTLIAYNGACSDTLVRPDYINITYITPNYAPPTVPFTGCIGIASTFQANNPNGINFLWNFGDGSTATGPNPTHTYTQPGTYQVSLVTMTADSCQEMINNFASVIIGGEQPQVTNSSQSCGAPYTVNFGTTTPAQSYYWEFSDGTTSNLPTPSHVYPQNGYYNVSLTTVDSAGCVSEYNGINQLALFPFQAGISNSCTYVGPTTVQSILNPIPSDASSVLWIFEDGTTSTQINPTIIAENEPTNGFQVIAIITSPEGCIDTVQSTACDPSPPPAQPQPSESDLPPDTTNIDSTWLVRACAPFELTFNNQFLTADSVVWHFGDGSTSTEFVPEHEYTTQGMFLVFTEVYEGNDIDTVWQPYIIDIGGHSPSILISQQNFCDSITVLLQGFAPNAVSYLWTLGNGDTETAQSFYYTYNNTNQTYHVQLTTVDIEGCVGMATNSVYSAIEEPDFYFETVLCNDPLVINHNIDTTFSFAWNFGDGNTSTQPKPTHNYANAGQYNLSLTVIDALGCSHVYALNPVTVVMPKASFIASAQSGCAPLTVMFTSTSTGYGPGMSHAWSVNNANMQLGTFAQPNFRVFNTPGTYIVSLRVINPAVPNCFDIFYDTITVVKPIAGFEMSQNKTCFQPDITVQFQDTSSAAVSWLWNFGNGQTSTLQNPSYAYTALPTDTISLTVTDAYGCSATAIQPGLTIFNPLFVAPPQVSCGNAATTLSVNAIGFSNFTTVWNLGDGSPQQQGNTIQHIYTLNNNYTVTAYVTAPDGCIDTVTHNIDVVQPSVDFYSNTPAACAPSNVVFFNQSIGNNTTAYTWNFGDGSIITNNNPVVVKTYTVPGVYDVSVIATTPEGCADTLLMPQYITVLGPIADFIVTSNFGCTDKNIDFINISQNVATFDWFFGDGEVDSTNYSPTHSFNQEGTYLTTLIVSDTVGCTSIMTIPTPITIYTSPTAVLDINYPSGCAPYTPLFGNNSLNATSYTWLFGDGNYNFDSIPQYTYNTPGNYQLSLIASGGNGCLDTAYANIQVFEAPVAAFTLDILDSTCNNITLGFNPTTPFDSLATYKWDFGNGQVFNGYQPAPINFDSSGTFTVTFGIVNAGGCPDTATATIILNVPGTPSGALTTTDTLGCEPFVVNFNMFNMGADSIAIDFGDGTTPGDFNPTHTYATAGTYQARLFMYNSFGCADTVYSAPITVIKSPVANFVASDSVGCALLDVNFFNTSLNTQNPTYLWNFGNGISSGAAVPPQQTYNLSGSYSVSLIIINQNLCADTIVKPSYIVIADTIPPPAVAMQRVTVVNGSRVAMAWSPSTAADFGSYRLYRKNLTQNTPFVLIQTITNPANTNALDTGLNTIGNVYGYFVETRDVCDNTRGIDSASAHYTINVRVNLLPNYDRVVKWTLYGGCDVDYYEVYRTTGNGWNDTTTTYLLATVPGTQDTYVDTSVVCPRNYTYRIKGQSLCAGPLYSFSDTTIAPQPKLDFTTYTANITRSTVVDNSHVNSQWLAPFDPTLISYYTIYRSLDSVNYQSIGQISGPFNSADMLMEYDDFDANIQDDKYFYRIETASVCNDKTSTGQTGDNIVLDVAMPKDAYEVQLSWTPYRSWGILGVDYYVIEYQDAAGNWQTLELPAAQFPDNKIPGDWPTSYTAPY